MPGMLCDAGLWAPIESTVDAPVVHPRLTEPSITGMAEQLLSSVAGDFLLVGLSLGAIVGFEVARLAPERMAGFAALSTNAAAPRREQYEGWERMTRRTELGEFATITEEVLTTMYATPRPSARLARSFREMAERVGEQQLLAQLTAQSTRTDARPVLPRIAVPALVACGTRDALCPPEFHREIAETMPDAELHLVPEAGHLLPLEAPTTTAALLNRLIRRCASTTPTPGEEPCPKR